MQRTPELEAAPPRLAPHAAPLLTVKQAAACLTLSKSYLDKMRFYGTGPRYHKLGAAIRYAEADLIEWLEQKRRSSTAQ